jgi:hypothetical protein
MLTTIWWWQIKERLAENKQRSRRFHGESFNLKKFGKVEDKEKYDVEVSKQICGFHGGDYEE